MCTQTRFLHTVHSERSRRTFSWLHVALLEGIVVPSSDGRALPLDKRIVGADAEVDTQAEEDQDVNVRLCPLIDCVPLPGGAEGLLLRSRVRVGDAASVTPAGRVVLADAVADGCCAGLGGDALPVWDAVLLATIWTVVVLGTAWDDVAVCVGGGAWSGVACCEAVKDGVTVSEPVRLPVGCGDELREIGVDDAVDEALAVGNGTGLGVPLGLGEL